MHHSSQGAGAMLHPEPVVGGQKFGPPTHQAQQQVSLKDLSSGLSLADLATRVKALGFPASCVFVLGLVER